MNDEIKKLDKINSSLGFVIGIYLLVIIAFAVLNFFNGIVLSNTEMILFCFSIVALFINIIAIIDGRKSHILTMEKMDKITIETSEDESNKNQDLNCNQTNPESNKKIKKLSMKEIKNYRELMYPLEWGFRAVVAAMLLSILAKLYPGQMGIFGAVVYYALLAAAAVAVIVQFVFFWKFLKKEDSGPSE